LLTKECSKRVLRNSLHSIHLNDKKEKRPLPQNRDSLKASISYDERSVEFSIVE